MKKIILFSSICMLFSLTAYNQTINIDFEAVEKGTTSEVQMDSVYVENINKDASTTLYYPNFLVSLDGSVSSEPIGFVNNNYGIKSIYPNPFSDFTNIIINNPESKQVRLSVYSLTGSLISNYEGFLTQGEHRFQVSTQYPGMYLVYLNDNSSLYKIISQPLGESSNSIRYVGTEADTYSSQENSLVLKSATSSSSFSYSQGDTIMVEGYADCFNNVIEYYVPQTSDTYVLEFQYNDEIVPTLETNDITVYLDANGDVIINKADLVANASDNCTLLDTTISISDFDCSYMGVQDVDVILRDKAGNSFTLSAEVIVEDTISPLLVIKSAQIKLDESGSASIIASDVVSSASDNCSLADTSLSQTIFDCNDLGLQSIQVSITDSSENETTLTAEVTVEDNINPSLTTKNYTVELDESGSATINALNVVEAADDNCSIADTALSQSIFGCSDLGVQEISVTVTDGSGNSTTKSTNITVEDNIFPTLTTKNITIGLNESGLAIIKPADVVQSADDNCTLADTSLSKSEFGCSELGVQEINVKVTDASGNSTTKTVEVTIEESANPSLTTKSISVELDENGTATITAADVVESAGNSCSSLSDTTLSKSEFGCSDLGVQEINVTVKDGSGNSTTKTAEVTVVDNAAPSLTTKAFTVELNGSNYASIEASDVIASADDNCSITNQSLSESEFSCEDLGVQEINVTVTDGSGNFTTKTAEVTVEEKILPNLTTKSATFQLNSDGVVIIEPKDVVFAASDNCSLSDTLLSKSEFSCSDIGSQTITVTLVDKGGNQKAGTANVTIQDNIKPLATPRDITVGLDASGNATITADDVLSSYSDNCSINSITLTQSSFDCDDIPVSPIEVTITLTDASGNETIVKSYVTVEDNIAPSLTVKDRIEVVLDVNQQATIKASDVVLSTSDNCSATFDTVVSPSTITTTGNQEVQVDVTLTDESGNETTKQVTVEVIDNIEDIQGNVYDVVQIGEQAWMAENMRATEYSDHSTIPLETDTGEWEKLHANEVFYCYQANDLDNLETYGVLYTWAAAMHSAAGTNDVPSTVQGVCPTGWHIPSDGEWEMLVEYIRSQHSGDVTRTDDIWNGLATYLKSNSLWYTESSDPETIPEVPDYGTDDYGFNALPGGDRNQHGIYYLLTHSAIFWTATDEDLTHVRAKQIRFDYFQYLAPIDKKRGINVRCVKD